MCEASYFIGAQIRYIYVYIHESEEDSLYGRSACYANECEGVVRKEREEERGGIKRDRGTFALLGV